MKCFLYPCHPCDPWLNLCLLYSLQEFAMRFVCTLIALCLVPMAALGQEKKEAGPIKEITLDLKEPVTYRSKSTV